VFGHWIKRKKEIEKERSKRGITGRPKEDNKQIVKVRFSLCLIKHHTTKTSGRVRYNPSIFNLSTKRR
jgi:hypothetical protein